MRLVVSLRHRLRSGVAAVDCPAGWGGLRVPGFKMPSCFCAPGDARMLLGSHRCPVPPPTPQYLEQHRPALEARLPRGWRDPAIRPCTPRERWEQGKPRDAESRIRPSAWGGCCGQSLGEGTLMCGRFVTWERSSQLSRAAGRVCPSPAAPRLPSAAAVTRPGGLSRCPGTSSRNVPGQEACLMGTKHYWFRHGFLPNFGSGSRLSLKSEHTRLVYGSGHRECGVTGSSASKGVT